MLPLRIEGANVVMKAPPGKEGEVRDLHALVAEGCCVSAWEPTPEELATLNAGGSVLLWIMGHQPPVMLTVKPHAALEGEDAS